MSCQGCAPAGCLENYQLEDVDLYSIQGDPFLWVTSCPPGFDCKGQGGPISMQCCDEVITLILPPFPTDAQFQAVIASLVSACAARSPFCAQGGPDTTPTGGGGGSGGGGGGGGSLPGGTIPIPPILPNQPRILYFNHSETCTVKCADGSPFSYTVVPGKFLGLTQSAADFAAFKSACSLAGQHRICLSNLPDQWCSGTAFNKTITAKGSFLAQFPLSDFWEVTGTLPTGVTFNGGFIVGGVASFSGTPTTPGSYTFTVSITDPSGDQQSKTYTICIVGIQNSDPLPDATQGTPYSQTLTAPACATAPLNWQVTSGQLPPGLTLDQTTGIISGTPTASASFVFVVTVQTQAT